VEPIGSSVSSPRFDDRSDRVITDDLLARHMTFPNVLIASHQAFLTDVALDNIWSSTVANLRPFIAGCRGKALDNVVLPAVAQAG